jgi:signal transduction histidine kinase
MTAYTRLHVRPLGIKSLPVRWSLPLFLALVVCLAIWQVWLTWRLMGQDRNLAAQQSRYRLEQIADLALAQLASKLGEWELSLRELESLPPASTLQANLPANGVLVLLSHQSVDLYPAKHLLFVPEPPMGGALPAAFEMASKLEFQDRNYDGALAILQLLVEQPAKRAEALLRTARLDRRLGRPAEAIAAYHRLTSETDVSPDGVPYALLATGALAEETAHGAATVVEQLRSALLEGRWRLRRDTFEYYWAEVNRLKGSADDPPKDSFEFSSLVSRLYENWQQAVRTGSSVGGRETEGGTSLLIWRATPSQLTALFVPSGWLGASLRLPATSDDIRWTLQGPGAPAAAPSGAHVVRSLSEAQLSGKLDFSSTAILQTRWFSRAFWLGGVALMLLLMLAGAYAMYRGVNRELRVAQLQSDFVAAVSHEFRSPLTTLRTITELLAQDRITDEARRRQSYLFLDRETIRLNRLVEDLLDFGRMESGRKQYRIDAHDVFQLVRSVIADFSEEAQSNGFQVEANLDSQPAMVLADQEAFRRALRNLLENAVKYSPECRTVWVEGHLNHRRVAISVRDQGMGIDPREQREIFQKFVRGAAAKKAGIKGTGIGLSMVRQIVSACGGDLRLESAVGAGSTFTITLPLVGTRGAADGQNPSG